MENSCNLFLTIFSDKSYNIGGSSALQREGKDNKFFLTSIHCVEKKIKLATTGWDISEVINTLFIALLQLNDCSNAVLFLGDKEV